MKLLVIIIVSLLVLCYLDCRSHCFQREERNLATFLTAAPDTWVASAYEVTNVHHKTQCRVLATQ